MFNRLGSLPTRNFQHSTFAHAENLSGESLTENNFSRRNGCAACTIRCERLFKSLDGQDQRLEYETLFALGPMCEIEDPHILLQAARLCDDYGLDSISTGATIAWAMECAEKGLLPEASALGLRFGQAERVSETHSHDCRAVSDIGDLLAQGSKRAAAIIGKDSRTVGNARQGPRTTRIRTAQLENHGARTCRQPPRCVSQPFRCL